MIPRWLHHLYAFVAGYFWAPCHRCGRMYGGHEYDALGGGTDWYDVGRGHMTCPRCLGDTWPDDYTGPRIVRLT